MTQKEVATMLGSIANGDSVVPCAYYQFPNNTEQQPPFICFYYDSSRDLMADNINYQKIEHLVVELYTREKDFDLEAQLEGVFTQNGLKFARAEQFLGDELMMVEVYDIDIIITEEEDG